MVSFTAESTIHGVTFIFGKDRHILVRIFWIILFGISIYGLFFYLHGCHTKWQTSPDIIMKTNRRNITEFPVPAMTICPTIIGRSNLANLTWIFNQTLAWILRLKLRTKRNLFEKFPSIRINMSIPGWNDEACAAVYHRYHFCTTDKTYFLSRNTQCNDDVFRNMTAGKTFFQFINERSLNFEEISDEENYWAHESTNERERVKKVLVSPYGVCYSINLYSKEIFETEKFKDLNDFYDEKDPDIEWSNDREYFNKNSLRPKKFNDDTLKIGNIDTDFNRVLLFIDFEFNETDIENVCANQTMKIIFHQSNEIATRYHETVVDLDFMHSMIYRIEVESNRMNLDLKRVEPNYRRCFFEDERKLKFFKKYSEAHCKLEALQEHLTHERKCDMADFPTLINSTRRACTVNDFKSVMDQANFKKHMLDYNCMPNCNSLKYILKNVSDVNMRPNPITRIMVFKESPFVEEKEQFSTYSLSNLISDIGGYLGLFLGCSMLSIVEIFFFAWARLIKLLQFLLRKRNSTGPAAKEIKLEEKVENLQKLYNLLLIQCNEMEIKYEAATENFNNAMRRLQEIERRLRVEDEEKSSSEETIYLT